MTTTSRSPHPSPFPPPTRHNIAIGEVFSQRGNYFVVSGLLDTKAVCYGSTGKARSIAFDKLTDNFHKLGFKEAIAFQKRVGRLIGLLVKTSAKIATPKKDKTKAAPKSVAKPTAKSSAKRAPKKMVNAPAPGPNPSLN